MNTDQKMNELGKAFHNDHHWTGVELKMEARIKELEEALSVSHFQADVLEQYHRLGTIDRHESCKMMNNDSPHPLLINEWKLTL